MTHLHYFEHHMIFTSKSETFTFALLLVPAGRYNFRKIFGRFRIKFKNIDFGPKNASFTPFRAEYKFSLKIQNSLFKSILNAFHQEQFQKNLMNWFRKKFKLLIVGPKMMHLSHFGHENFSQKRGLHYYLISCIKSENSQSWEDSITDGQKKIQLGRWLELNLQDIVAESLGSKKTWEVLQFLQRISKIGLH